MEKLATQLLNSLSDWAKNNPDTVNSMLLAGGAGALAGSLLPASSDDPEEGASSRVMRRVRNALIGGAIGAGGAGLLGYGLNQLGTAIPKDEPKPLEDVANTASSGLARAGYGLGALGTTGVITEKMRRRARANLVSDMGLAGNKSMTRTEKLLKAFKSDPTALFEAGKHLPEQPAPLTWEWLKNKRNLRAAASKIGIPYLGRISTPTHVTKKLAEMGVHINRSTPWAYSKSLLKGNWKRGLVGLGAAGLAAASPDVVSWFTGD